MDRSFDYQQKILLAVELGTAPRRLDDLPAAYSVFQRVSIPEVIAAFDESHGLVARLVGGRKFRDVLDQHMGYWEKRVPAGQSCFVHYLIGKEDLVAKTYARLQAAGGWKMLGVYHVEPQSSSYPFGFPGGATPNHWSLGESRTLTRDSIFWFNFFPAQPYLFEKTFPIWMLFNMYQGAEGGECNQLVAWEGKERLLTDGVDEFVQVNLNRFTSLPGYFNAAFEAGKHSFTNDPDYRWYGMVLRKV